MVKRLLSILLLGVAALTANAQYQFPNSTFDEDFISSYGSYTEPRGWHGYASIDASPLNSAGRTGSKLVQSDAVRPGASGKCVYIKSTAIMGVVANGVLTNGQIYTHSTTATDGSGNYNFSDPSNTKASGFGENNQFFTPFTGRPDAFKVWMKFAPAKSNTGNARVSLYTHKAGTKMYDPTNKANMNDVVSHAEMVFPACDWTQFTIPFSYDYESGQSTPGLILATFTTNETPGEGSDGDMLYIDDIEMVYYSTLLSCTYNGADVNFNGFSAVVDELYNFKLFNFTTGAGAKRTVTEPTPENGYTLTIKIEGNDVSVNPSNTHTYTIKFAGLASGIDDEHGVNIIVPDLKPVEEFVEGKGYYLYHPKHNGYLDHNDKLEQFSNYEKPRLWTVDPKTIYDNDGHYFTLDRLRFADKIDYANFEVQSTRKENVGDFTNVFNNGYLRIYRKELKYYDGNWLGLGKRYADIYLGASSLTALTACNATDENGKWQLFDPFDYMLYSISSRAAGCSMTNPYPYSLEDIKENVSIEGLPLGLYSIDGGEKFYLKNEAPLNIAATDGTLTYYGRLDFSLNATFDGAKLSDNQKVNAVYDASKLSVDLSKCNGAQSYQTYFDEKTYELTITIKGYGRQNEYTVKFAAPDLSLNATWYGEKIEDGAKVNEPYAADKLVVTPGLGAKAETVYNEETGVATVTISSATASETYSFQFVVLPEVVGEAKTYKVDAVYNNGTELTNPSANFVFTLETLENNNINFSAYVPVDGTVKALNIPLAKDGTFSYAGTIRTGDTHKLTPVTFYGKVVDGELVCAVADVRRDYGGTKYLFHEIYAVNSVSSKDYVDDIVVTINGDATVIPEQTVSLSDLENGNVSFTLKNFQMDINGAPTYIGNIFLENLPIDADGNFTFNGGMLIGPGADKNITWGGLDLGIVPLNLRGQRYNNGEDVIVVIDIDMQESLGQTIHVTFGAGAVSEKTYTDNLIVTINGESATVPNTNVVVGTLKNGNISFTLQDFSMVVNGENTPIGNIAIDNIALDEKGNFTYEGIIRIGKGTDPDKTWGGPDLGDVPVVIRGSVFDYAGGNGGDSQCTVVIDIDMQESLGQTIHVTYGLEVVSEADYTDILAVTVNGECSTQETTVTLQTLRNGNINFTLDNFKLEADGFVQPIGAIRLENLIFDENGKFSYEGVIRIAEGSDPDVSNWGGPELGDVPVIVDGQLYTIGGESYLLLNIDIDMEESLGQTINVTFGATPVSTTTYTDDLKVTVNGEATTEHNVTVSVGTLKNGYKNLTLNNFAMNLGGEKTYLGNIALNALALDENGKFTYTGNIRIGDGDLPEVENWGGADLGAIPVDVKGQFYTYAGNEYLIFSIAIDMQESIQQTIDVLYGGTPIRVVDLHDNLKVTINDQDNHQEADVAVGILRNGNINFTLRNFMLQLEGSQTQSGIGNISVDNLELASDGSFTYNGVVRVGNGDDTTVDSWGGPDLGDIPVVLTGRFSEEAAKAHVLIDIDMMDTLSQIINVEFGVEFLKTIGDLTRLIEKAKAGEATVSDINTLLNNILEK